MNILSAQAAQSIVLLHNNYNDIVNQNTGCKFVQIKVKGKNKFLYRKVFYVALFSLEWEITYHCSIHDYSTDNVL